MARHNVSLVVVALITVACVAVYWSRHQAGPAAATPRDSVVAGLAERGPESPTPAKTSSRSPKLAALAADMSPDSVSPIANELNAPDRDIHHDVEILNDVFVAWRTNFSHVGNPVGENDEITLALCGANPLHFAFIAPTHPAINARGELCDRWGTPFRFHQLSGTQMEIRSAGPDRKFATADDVQFAPGGNPP